MRLLPGNSGGAQVSSGTAVPRAFNNNVSVGSLITVVGIKFSPTIDAYVVGDCTASAGTATVDTPVLDVSVNFNHSASSFIAVGIWSCLVTVAGSLTMQVGGALASSSLIVASDETQGRWGADRKVSSSSASSAGSTTPSSGNITGSNYTDGLFIGGVATATSGSVTHTEDSPWGLTFEDEAGATDMTGSAIIMLAPRGTTDAASWVLGSSVAWAAAAVVYKEITPTLRSKGNAVLYVDTPDEGRFQEVNASTWW